LNNRIVPCIDLKAPAAAFRQLYNTYILRTASEPIQRATPTKGAES